MRATIPDAATAAIDKGSVTTIFAYLGGFRDSNTGGMVAAAFLNAAEKEVGRIETQPYDTK